jgi:hypothetical protein
MLKAALVLLLVATAARAQPKSDAERLFEEGRALIEAGNPDEACAKFEQSLAKDPRQVGVLMNLGLCNERRGKIGTALRLYQEAFDRASEARLSGVRDAAKDQIAQLAPKVPVLVITRAPLPGEKLVIDDRVIPSTTTELALDPGLHAVVLTAPGHLPFETHVELVVGEREALVLPALRVPEPGIVAAPASSRSSRRTAGKVTTLVGAGIGVAAGALAIYAKLDYDALFDDPDGDGPKLASCGAQPPIEGKPACDDDGQSRSERDRSLMTGAAVIGVVGIATAATGLVLWLTAPTESQTRITPTASTDGVGFAVTGRF